MFFIDDTLHCFSLTTHGSFESAKQLGWGLALLPNVRRDLLPPMPMHGAQPPTLRLSFQWSLSSREAENDNPTAHFVLARTSRCMYCTVRRDTAFFFLVSCFARCLFCLRRLSYICQLALLPLPVLHEVPLQNRRACYPSPAILVLPMDAPDALAMLVFAHRHQERSN